MLPPFNPIVIILGGIGGLGPDLIRIAKNRHNNKLPSYIKHINFYLGIFALFLLGALVVYILEPSQALEAVCYGYAAPSILSSLGGKSQIPPDREKIDRGAVRGDSTERREFKIREWWGS